MEKGFEAGKVAGSAMDKVKQYEIVSFKVSLSVQFIWSWKQRKLVF